ncbi:MAG: hypothetical protein Q4D03_09420 [Bacteroidales bacterium]|nr:hypothetical protein [Bacteroidales bacterium]
MKKIMFLCVAMIALVACNNSKVANDMDSTIDTDTPVANVPMEEAIKDSVDQIGKDLIYGELPLSFDFISREEWIEVVKGAVRYDRDYDSITLDSAIKLYSSSEITRDSIVTWWGQR